MSERVLVPTDGGAMPAYLWLPPGGRSGPGLVLLQEIFGVSPYIRSRAHDLAAAGYVVLAPDLYWRLDRQGVDESAPDALEQAMALAARLDWETTVRDATGALAGLRERPEISGGSGVLGFCFGGGLAFHLAAVADPDALVAYYGSAIPRLLDLAPLVRCPALHHFGLEDEYFEPDALSRIRTALDGRTRIETYPGANHAFDNPDFPLHHPEASALAWERTLGFLAEELPAG